MVKKKSFQEKVLSRQEPSTWIMVLKTNPNPSINPFENKENSTYPVFVPIPSVRNRIRYPKARTMQATKKNIQAEAERILTKARKLMGLSSMFCTFSMVRVVTYSPKGMKNLD